MKKFKIISLEFSKDFTLIELLVVMAILGVLAVGLVAAINPLEKIRQSNDAKAISGLGVLARAAESYATARNGFYPATLADLTTSGELKVLPAGAYAIAITPAGCTTACTAIVITIPLTSVQYATTPVARYESSTGKQCVLAASATACP